MKIIYTISPQYLEHIKNESEPYDFCIQGYGNFIGAIRDLTTVNISEVLGYIILLKELPEDVTDIVTFIDKVSVYKANKPLVLAVQDKQGLDIIMSYADISGINLFVLTEFDMVTDRVIRQDLFGTILKQYTKPYVKSFYGEEIVDTFDYTKANTLEYKPLFSKYVNLCLEKIEVFGDYKRTVNKDKSLKQIDKDSIYYHIRLLAISVALGIDKTYREQVIQSILDTLKQDDSEYTLAKSLYELARDGFLN